MMTVAQAFELALEHHGAGRLVEAEALCGQILGVQPNHAGALRCLGDIANQSGRPDVGIGWLRRAVATNPDDPATHSDFGTALARQGCHDEALAAFRRAIQLKPDDAESYNNLGNVLRERGELDEAIVSYRQALDLKPDFATAYYNLGIALTELGRIDEAVAAYRQALELKPDYATAHYNLGIALREQGKLEESIFAFRRAHELKANYPDACFNLAVALKEHGDLDEAIAAYRLALELKPDFAEAHNNLGRTLADLGKAEEAIAEYRRAFALRPECAWMQSNILFTLAFVPRQDAIKIAAKEQEIWNQKFGDPHERVVVVHSNDREPERRLHIGYVSPDFRDHVAGRNLRPLFKHHDRRNFEILCYSGVAKPDGMTKEFREHTNQWRSTVGIPDEAVAEMIRRDGVDVLVDLSQHTADNRLPIFARKPAPVRASFAAYPGSAGVEAIGFRISDRWLEAEMGSAECGWTRDPDLPSSNPERRPVERVFLIDSFWCYDPCGVEIGVNALPAWANGQVTFGSLNNFCKVNEPVLQLWARVLAGAQNSRLLILAGVGIHRQRTLEFLEREGVEPHRVEFIAPLSRRDYLELYHRVDLMLDTFPYNGHTTSLDALWMGVPVVSLVGEQPVARAGLSQLSNVGLAELAAFSEDEYVGIATQLAHDLPRLAELRATLRSRMERSVLMDGPRFAGQIEAAYRAMWRQWCRQEKDA